LAVEGVTEPAAVETEPTSVFLRACQGLPTERTPVWLLRQAGRYQPEYRTLREKHSLLDLVRTPELAAQVTLLPIESFGLDAAIVFSDILPPLVGMGLDLEFVKGDGPRIGNRIDSPRDADLLGTPPAEETMAGTLEAIRIVRSELEPRDIPVIGFAGAPFTLASYAIEGGHSTSFAATKSLMYAEPAAWHRLAALLAEVVGDYLAAQVEAGAQALQVFDSWVGALDEADYREFVRPHVERLFARVRDLGVPLIHFGVGTAHLLPAMRAAGGDVIGVDWRTPLDRAAQALPGAPLQGNLDPTALLGPRERLLARVDAVLAAASGLRGHVFNLGHGILPPTPVDNVRAVVEHVHERTAARGAA
jgi:uroporphyrinogen decarboxylase